jgi:hypothetical protein
MDAIAASVTDSAGNLIIGSYFIAQPRGMEPDRHGTG